MYPPARIVAQRLQSRLAASASFKNVSAELRPDAATIEEIISIAFWASLRREEGRAPRISIAFLPPEQSSRPVQFNPPVPLQPDLLARLAPAVEQPGIHIGAWSYEGKLFAWGLTRTVPTWCSVLEVAGPGLLVLKYRRDDPATKFVNIAVLEGAEVKFIEQQPSAMSEAPAALGSLLEFYSSAGRNQSDALLVKVAIAMRGHGRGGTLLVVPKNGDQWRQSILQPIRHSLIPPFPDIATFPAIEGLAGLTAVDGATIITDQLEPLAFGAKILTRDGVDRVQEILLTEPIEGIPDRTVDPPSLGGTRHLSAAQFAHDQHEAVALVASQDGQFTVFAWSSMKGIVHAHRLDALLL